MTTVAEVLNAKSNARVFHVSPSQTVLDALRLMAEQGIGAVVVLEGDKLAGIFTERDYARKVVLLGRSSGDTPVSDIMTRAVRYVHSTQSTEECMALMTENRLRHLPVIDDGRLVGLVSIGDLVKHVMSQQQFVIAQMEQYITGGW